MLWLFGWSRKRETSKFVSRLFSFSLLDSFLLIHWAVEMVQNRQILVQVGGGEAIFLLPDVYTSLENQSRGTGTGTCTLTSSFAS